MRPSIIWGGNYGNRRDFSKRLSYLVSKNFVRKNKNMVSKQNTSHAVMAQRIEPSDSLDDFPTPPWATRALIKHIIGIDKVAKDTCLEPACNRGFMSRTLEENFKTVTSSDVFDYGYGEVRDFLNGDYSKNQFDWVITNPPFKLAEGFINEGLKVATQGVAMLTRTTFIESVGRYERLFSSNPPTIFAQFVERVPMVKGRLDKSASTATGYCWLVWEKGTQNSAPKLAWIPPTRKKLERLDDYELPTQESKQKSLF